MFFPKHLLTATLLLLASLSIDVNAMNRKKNPCDGEIYILKDCYGVEVKVTRDFDFIYISRIEKHTKFVWKYKDEDFWRLGPLTNKACQRNIATKKETELINAYEQLQKIQKALLDEDPSNDTPTPILKKFDQILTVLGGVRVPTPLSKQEFCEFSYTVAIGLTLQADQKSYMQPNNDQIDDAVLEAMQQIKRLDLEKITNDIPNIESVVRDAIVKAVNDFLSKKQ